MPPQHGLNAAGHVYLVVGVADFPWGFQITVAGAVAAGRLAVTLPAATRLGRYPVKRGGVGLLEFGGAGLASLLGHGHLAFERLDIALVALHFGLDAGHGFLVFLQRAPQPGLALGRTCQ